MTRSGLLSLLLSSFALACGSPTQKGDTTPASDPPPAPPAPAASTAPTAAAAPAEEPKKRRPYEVFSNCGDVVTVAFGDDPKTAGKRTISPSSAIEGSRNADGNMTVWLLDDKGEGLVKVQVTRGMKRVEVGKSCRTMDAH